MPVLNSIAAYAEEMKTWRRWLHRHPELGFDCHGTAAYVAERLTEFGVDEIHTGIAESGIVAIIAGRGEGPTVGLRADMDALPIEEATGAEHASTRPGIMHACGHDGHTTMLLGAAKYLAATRNFKGRVALIFQPAEEHGGGGGVMVDEGIMDRFDIAEVYALHTAPGLTTGHFFTTPGPIMAAVDDFYLTVTGKGGHAAMPHLATDPIPAALAFVQAVQTIVTRNADPLGDLVISVTVVQAGTASNVIPATAKVAGTVRTFAPEMRDMAERRMREMAEGIARSYGVGMTLDYQRHYPATVNDTAKTAFAAEVAAEVAGEQGVEAEAGREFGAEDFAYMLQARPGAYLFLGQGEGAFVHHPEFDFNDDIAPIGASFFARVVERALPV